MATRRQKPKGTIKARAEPRPAWMPAADDEEPEETLPVIGRPRGSTKQQLLWNQAIAAMLLIPNMEQAAESIGVDRTTLYNWLQNPEFNRQYVEARRQGMAIVLGAVCGQAAKTLQTLVDLRDNAKSEMARTSAAKILMEYFWKVVEQERESELVNEVIRENERVIEELKEGQDGEGDRLAGIAALTDGRCSAEGEAVGEGDGAASGAGEGEADVGV